MGTFEGVHIDAWWNREEAAKKTELNTRNIQHCQSEPLTIVAVDAPVLAKGPDVTYTAGYLEMLARKIALIYATAGELKSPQIVSGLLGGGAFRNNRPVV